MKLTSLYKTCVSALVCGSLAACAPSNMDVSLVEGPAIIDVVTPFDGALACLDGKIDKRLGFAVGNIPDGTGRESYNGDGVGRFVTQSGGDMVQSALFKTGVKVINRRDMGSAALEAQWGIRTLASQQNAHFAITGSINSLDFIPGAGAFVNVGGVGARYTQSRILVGLDLAMTNVATGHIVSNIALKKQIVANDAGIFGSRFTDNRLVDTDIGGARREALNDALRAMLQLATLELMLQLMPPEQYTECIALIDPRYGVIGGKRTAGEQYASYQLALEEQAALNASTQTATSTSLNVNPGTVAPEGDQASSVTGQADELLASAAAASQATTGDDAASPAIPDNRPSRDRRNPYAPPQQP